jgi:hypothetical protein
LYSMHKILNRATRGYRLFQKEESLQAALV